MTAIFPNIQTVNLITSQRFPCVMKMVLNVTAIGKPSHRATGLTKAVLSATRRTGLLPFSLILLVLLFCQAVCPNDSFLVSTPFFLFFFNCALSSYRYSSNLYSQSQRVKEEKFSQETQPTSPTTQQKACIKRSFCKRKLSKGPS